MLTNDQLLQAYQAAQVNDGTLIDSLRAVANVAAEDRQRMLAEHWERSASYQQDMSRVAHLAGEHDDGFECQTRVEGLINTARCIRSFKEG